MSTSHNGKICHIELVAPRYSNGRTQFLPVRHNAVV